MKRDEVFREVYGGEPSLDVYEMVALTEKKLFEEGILPRVNRESYLKLVDDFQKKGVRPGEFRTIKDYSLLSGLIVREVVLSCPFKVVVEESNELESTLVEQLKIKPKLACVRL